MSENKNIYFASDFHLGSDGVFSSKEREMKIVRWLDSIKEDAGDLYLMGDIFDYWFEYAEVIPRGFTLFLGKLHSLALSGINIYIFTGNHDKWFFDYLEEEIGATIYRKPIVKAIGGKKFYLAHGDVLGSVSFWDKLVNSIFENKFLQWMFARIHPNTGIRIMKYFSNLSRNSHSEYDKLFIPEREYLLGYAEEYSKKDDSIHYFVFGHRHIPIIYPLSNKFSSMVNLGDWIEHFTYGVFDGNEFKLKKYEE